MARRPTRAGTRRVIGLWAVGAVLAAVLALGAAEPASACSCLITQAGAVAEADAVFTGTLDPSTHADAGRYLFAVDQVFKGRVHEAQWIVTETNSCGTWFSGSEPFLVIAVAAGSELHTDFCLQSGLVSEGLPDGLGPPTDPVPGTSPGLDAWRPTWQLLAALAGVATIVSVVAAGLAGVTGVVRRRRAPAGG